MKITIYFALEQHRQQLRVGSLNLLPSDKARKTDLLRGDRACQFEN